MTTPTAPADTTTQPTSPPADTYLPTEPTEPTGESQPENPNSEAARWRVRLREVETERDALAERVTGYQRSDCERVVADLLAQPADLWDIGRTDVNACMNQDGTVNEEGVRAAAEALIASRPGLAKNPAAAGPRQWGQGNAQPSSGGVGWGDVIKNR